MKRNSRKFKGIVFRIHHKDKDPLDTSGSKKIGGRWNRKGTHGYGAVYTSLDKSTLKAEFLKAVEIRGLKVENLFNMRISEIEVTLEKVLDLTDSNNRKEFKIQLSDIASDEMASKEKCLEVADEARKQGFEAILSPSAPDPKGKNLNIYKDKISGKSKIETVSTESLLRI